MKTISGKELANLLEKKGWELKNTKRSHHVYMKAGNPARISIPIHGNKSLKIALLRHFLKIADIEEKDL